MEQELITLGILFFFALIGGILAAKFKQPILLGLLLVGAIIGPKAIGIIHDESVMESMIEFGAILMLFVLGLEFDIPKIKKIGLKAITIACLNSAILTFVGFIISICLGFSVQASLFMGVILAFGSTVVIVKVLENKGLMDRQEVPLLVAILIIEDILAVLIITFFSGVQNKSIGLIGNIENLVISSVILILTYLLFVKFIKPLLYKILEKYNGEEIITFTALAMCAGFAYIANTLGLSPAVGAFLAGSIVASLPNAKKFEHAIAPYNLIISSFFFIAIGTLIDFAAIQQYIMIIIILVGVVIVTKITAFSGMMYFFANMKGDRMFFSSIAMFSIGEFSLLVAKESTNFNVGIDLVSISAAIVAISAVIMSVAINYSDKLYEPTRDWMPYSFRVRFEKFANYIKYISEELDLDNKYSKGLKMNVFKALLGLLIIMLSIFGWRKLSTMLSAYDVNQAYITIGYFTTLAIVSIMMFYLIYKIQKIMKSLGEIFANATNSTSTYHSRIIVKRAFAGFTLLWLALLWPFAMFLFNTSPYLIFVSAAFLAVSIWQFHKISVAMSDHIDVTKDSFPSYRKWDYSDRSSNTRNINQGWKL